MPDVWRTQPRHPHQGAQRLYRIYTGKVGLVAEHSRRPSVLEECSRRGEQTEVLRTRDVTAKFAQRSQIWRAIARRWADKIGDGLEKLAANAAERHREARTGCGRVACSRIQITKSTVIDDVASIRSLWARIPATAVATHVRQSMPSSFSPRRPSRSQRIPSSSQAGKWLLLNLEPAAKTAFGLCSTLFAARLSYLSCHCAASLRAIAPLLSVHPSSHCVTSISNGQDLALPARDLRRNREIESTRRAARCSRPEIEPTACQWTNDD
ncbi:uncharacterized protein M421DRAFT_93680 [Didymella exigua CBS 183.55]|uniref:Uncharacterized protein n=1 Tax=Didymella exigua CBS 183.55 TaxID=1150837 RepID=A0A6A5RHP8_9PLEO|nr:uncharacterized protein M421DRAFT_93680 [Didymella exigua CBS 183.55]KAF1926770.1 hypothetical protein M421DRAFT_93680 [Didymella exigua CBS 183.55]